MVQVGGRQLEFAQEQALARRILALEEEVARLVRGADWFTPPAPRRRGTTRAGQVDGIAALIERAPGGDRIAERARRLWREVTDLRWTLAMSATRVVYREARRVPNPVLGEHDLVQEGWSGLLDAAKRFDPERGLRFSTYAKWWVRAAMTRAIEAARAVRLPANAAEQLRNMRKERTLLERQGLTCSIAELANAVGIDPARAEMLLDHTPPMSLDEPGIGEDGLGLELPSEWPSPLEQATARQQLERLTEAIRTQLDERQRLVVTQRFGIGEDPKSLVEVGAALGRSRERVRQLQRSSFERLRTFVEGAPATIGCAEPDPEGVVPHPTPPATGSRRSSRRATPSDLHTTARSRATMASCPPA